MNLESYHRIFFVISFAPFIPALFVCFCVVRASKEEKFILTFLKGIVTKKNNQKKPALFICGRKLSISIQKYFTLLSAFIFAACIQTVLNFCVIEISYECRDDPKLDCYKFEKNRKLGEIVSIVNCTAISSADLVQCYRFVWFDSEKIFVAFSAAYLSFKILKIALLIVTNFMLWMASYGTRVIYICKFVLLLIVGGSLYLFIILSLTVKEFENTARNVSYPRFIQISLLITIICSYIVYIPWEKFDGLKEYLEEVSLPEEDQSQNERAENKDE